MTDTERAVIALERIADELKRQNDAVEARAKNAPDIKKLIGTFTGL